jgi:DNA-binding CsgD family transcriptional regulator
MLDSSSPESRLRLLDTVCSCSSFALVADRLLEPLASALGASSSVFLEFVERPGVGVGVGKRSYVGARPWSVDAYAERFFRADPLIERRLALLGEADGDETPSVNALPEAGEVRDSDYYHRFLRPSDIAHVVGLSVPFRSGLGRAMLCLGFHRRHGSAPFGAAELGLLQQLAPVMRSILSSLAAREALPLSGALVDRITRTHRGSGYLVFDEDLIVLHAGGRASEDLGIAAAGPGDAASGGSLLGELRRRLLAEPPPAGGAPQQFSLVRPTDALAVGIEAQAVATGSGQRLIVTTSAADARSPGDACGRYGLTARENEVARLVCAGSSNIGIARTLGIAVRTVENHLRSIYEKAGVRSRTQLAARLLL